MGSTTAVTFFATMAARLDMRAITSSGGSMRYWGKVGMVFVVCLGVWSLSACMGGYTAQHPRIRVYEPRYVDFTYKVDGKYQVKHSYLFGAGAKKCRYAGKSAEPYMEDGEAIYPYESSIMDNFFEKNGHIYQGVVKKDDFVLGYPYPSRLGGESDPKTGKQEVIVNEMWHSDPLCYSRIGSFEYGIRLQKSSSLSIDGDIRQREKLLGTAWKKFSHWDPTQQIQHGKNTWTVFKRWNSAIYLADAAEDWYLPIGDGKYYYKLTFAYQTGVLKDDPDQYAKGRAMFERILDSFEIRELTAAEQAVIVNPEPIEIDEKDQAEKREKFLQYLKKKRGEK